MYISLIICLIRTVISDVIVEKVSNFKPIRIYVDQPARFGNALPDSGLAGYLIHAHPPLACHDIQPPPPVEHLPPEVHWIALIRRSNSNKQENQCTFEDKVETAMKANYSAAIVYNYKNDELIPMGGNNPDLIPSVFIGYSDAVRLLDQYTYQSGEGNYLVRMTDNSPFDINAYLLPFAIVVGICFLIMLAIMIFKCIQDRRRERRHRLPKSSLKKIPTKKFDVGDEEYYETCCICLDDYVLGDKLRILPCGHAYHMKCIDPWLLKNKRVCPQCRKKVFASGEVPPTDSESETEDERRPLLNRPNRGAPGGTFTVQRQNPFRRADRAVRLQEGRRRRLSEGSDVSTSTDEGADRDSVGIIGNQLLAEVHIEQPIVERSGSPTFERADTHDVNITGGREEEESHHLNIV